MAFRQTDRLYDIRVSDVKPGMIYQTAAQGAKLANSQLYAGDLSPLFNITGDDYNGLKSYTDAEKQSIIYLNEFRRVSEFYTNALFSEPPTGLVNIARTVLEQATRYESVNGYGFITAELAEGNQIRLFAVDPVNADILFDETGFRQLGYLIAYPYHIGFTSQATERRIPNRIDIILWSADGSLNERRTYQYNGASLGALLEVQPTAIIGMWHFGNGVSDYADIYDLVRELCIRVTGQARVLNRHSSPHLVGPAPLPLPNATPGQPALPGPAPVYDSRGMYLPVTSREAPEYKYLTWEAGLTANRQQIEFILERLSAITGLPNATVGVAIAVAESGAAKERQLFTALSHLRRLQQQIETVIEAMQQVVPGLVEGDFTWPYAPFDDFQARAGAAAGLVGQGIIDAAVARELLFRGAI